MKKLISFCIFVLLSSFMLTAQNERSPLPKWSIDQEANPEDIYVEVTFYIDFDGSAKVIEIDSKKPDLIQFVLKKFEKIQVNTENYFVGKTMRYRFKFKEQPKDLS